MMGPAKLTEVSLEGDFKKSITRKRWLGSIVASNEAYESFYLQQIYIHGIEGCWRVDVI